MSESFGRGESALFLQNPELASAARRQRFAEELLGQAIKPRNVGGHAGGLAQMGQALIAGYMGYKEDERIKALAEAQRANESEQLRALMGGAMPAGQAAPATESALATPPGSLPPPVPIAPEGGEVPPMATALMNPPGQPGQPGHPPQGGAAQAMPLPPPVPVGGPAPTAAPAMAQPGGAPSMDAIIAGMASSSPRVRAVATAMYQRANRQEDLALRAQDRAEDRAFRLANRTPAAATAPAAPPMPFAGTSMEGQSLNILLNPQSNPNSPEYEAAFLRAYGAQRRLLPNGDWEVVRPTVPPSVRVPPSLANEFPSPASGGQATPQAAPGQSNQDVIALPGGGTVTRVSPGQRSLSAGEISLREETDNALKAAQSARSGLERALTLSPQAYAGPGAQTRGWAAGFTGVDPKTADATREFNTIMGQQALVQLRSIFGGNPTEGERKILLELEANANMSRVERETLIRRALEAVQRREADAARRLEDVVRGNFGRTDPGFSAPGRTPVPGASSGGGWSIRPVGE